MGVFDITKQRDAPVARGTGFYIENFGQVSIEWIEPEKFDPEYDKVQVIKAFIKSAEKLFDIVDLEYK